MAAALLDPLLLSYILWVIPVQLQIVHQTSSDHLYTPAQRFSAILSYWGDPFGKYIQSSTYRVHKHVAAIIPVSLPVMAAKQKAIPRAVQKSWNRLSVLYTTQTCSTPAPSRDNNN